MKYASPFDYCKFIQIHACSTLWQVKITPNSSRAHASSLKLELVSTEGYALDQKMSTTEKMSKNQKQAIIQVQL